MSACSFTAVWHVWPSFPFAEAPLSLHCFSLLTPSIEELLYGARGKRTWKIFSSSRVFTERKLIPSVWKPTFGANVFVLCLTFLLALFGEVVSLVGSEANNITDDVGFARNRAGQTCPCNQVWNTTAKQAFKINQVFISTNTQLNFWPLARSCQSAING